MAHQHCCPDCGQPLDVMTQGTNVARVNGVIVFTDTLTQVTCFTEGCQRRWITLEVNAFYALTQVEIDRYHTEEKAVQP